jgi:L-ascorbate metabolism protein UlaG (beta-lactamase superfamily)
LKFQLQKDFIDFIPSTGDSPTMNYTLLRHATAILEYHNRTFLIDPVLGAPSQPGDTADPRQPLTPLPENAWDEINRAGALLASHLHFDHLDATASKILPKSLPVLAQPEDVANLRDQGFEFVTGVATSTTIGEITLLRTVARHGHGKAAEVFAPASGYLLRAPGEPTLYIVGDSVWCEEVEETIRIHEPDVILLNGGAAHARGMGPITMDVDDLLRVRKASDAEIIVVHLDAFAHMTQSREFIDHALKDAGMREHFRIPADGEHITIDAAS